MKKNYNILADCRNMCEQDIINTIIDNRNIKDIDHFLNPTSDDLLPLESLVNINKARDIIINGISNNKKIGIHFDVDTDGICSGTEIYRELNCFTNHINTYINNGKKHGLIGQDISIFKDDEIIIIVDSLDKDVSQYKKLYELGKQIIVLDHHAIDENINYDEYVTLVSSQRNYMNKQLSGAGVVWKFCKYIDEYYNTNYADDLVDLACCGILADVCDISEDSKENRYIVYCGLNNLRNPAIKKILGSYEFNSKAVLFSIAPLINASCRMEHNQSAMKLFMADENKEVLQLKKELTKCKEEQSEEVEEIFPDVIKQFDEQKENKILYSIIDTEHGISGLIGNKCLEQYNKPIFILKDCGDKYMGSMRSIGYGDFRTICNNTKLAVLNGHEEASGIEIKKDYLDRIISTLNVVLSNIKQTTSSDIDVDCEINLSDISSELVKDIKRLNLISGSGFKPITFKVTDIDEYEVSNFKQGKHLVLKPNEFTQIIEWNTKADFDKLEDYSLMNEPIEVIGELDSGFFARRFMLKIIISDMKVGG